jgi:putative phosphoesterase
MVVKLKIGVISDTHLDRHPEKILDYLEKCFKDVDLIVHAGDYTNIKVINYIKENKKFVGVFGNVDKTSVREVVKEKEIVEFCGKKIGIFHGHGKKNTTIDRAYDVFSTDNVDIIIFGHSHQPSISTKNKILMLNPGSLSRKRKEPWFSYIILNLDKNSMDIQLKLFEKL